MHPMVIVKGKIHFPLDCLLLLNHSIWYQHKSFMGRELSARGLEDLPPVFTIRYICTLPALRVGTDHTCIIALCTIKKICIKLKKTLISLLYLLLYCNWITTV